MIEFVNVHKVFLVNGKPVTVLQEIRLKSRGRGYLRYHRLQR